MKLDPRALTAALQANRDHKADPGRKGCGIEKAILAYLTAIGETHVLVPKTALDWLDGAGPDANGHWFGDAPDERRKNSPAVAAAERKRQRKAEKLRQIEMRRAMLAAAKEGE